MTFGFWQLKQNYYPKIKVVGVLSDLSMENKGKDILMKHFDDNDRGTIIVLHTYKNKKKINLNYPRID